MRAEAASELDRAVEAGVERLFTLQAPGGWWVGELESNVTMTAQHLLFLEFLRIRDEASTFGVMAELLARQRADGLWSIYHGGEPDLNATLEAYAALRLAGLSDRAPQLAEARRFCEERGGIGATRVFTRIWLSLFGIWSWDDVPSLPVELALMRPWMPVSPYTFACWARQTVLPLAVVMHYRPVRPLPASRACHELHLGVPSRPRENVWSDVDRLLKLYGHSPWKPGRERALATAERWIVDRQELDGCWGGIQPPWVWSLIALACRGHGPDSPVMRRGLAGWSGFLVEDGDRLRPEACQSPGLGQRPRPPRSRRFGRRFRPSGGRPGDRLDPSRRGARPRRLGDPAPGGRARRLVLRVRQRPLPGRGRRGGRGARAA